MLLLTMDLNLLQKYPLLLGLENIKKIPNDKLLFLVKKDPSVIKTLHHEEISDQIIDQVIFSDPLQLKYVKPDRINKKQALLALDKNSDCYKYLPKKYITPEVIIKYVKKSPGILELLTPKYYSQDFFNQVVSLSTDSFLFVPNEFVHQDMCNQVCSKFPNMFQFIPDQFKTNELATLAVNNSSVMIQYVVKQTPELCLIALKKNKNVLKYITNVSNESYEEALEHLRKKIIISTDL